MIRPDPKPVRRPKKARRPLRRRHWGTRAKLKKSVPDPQLAKPAHPKPVQLQGTKHGRRERGAGKMAYLATLPCMVLEAFWDTFTNEDVAAAGSPCVPDPCTSFDIQVMHLRAEASQHRATEKRVAPGCVDHHQDIDGQTGGRGPWYVALGRINQRRLRDMLSELGEAYWMNLTQAARDAWDALAAAQIKERRV